MTTIAIVHLDGVHMKEVDALEVAPGLAVHRTPYGPDVEREDWTITHSSSGLQVAYGYMTKEEATKTAFRIAKLTDWTQSENKIQDLLKKTDLMAQVKKARGYAYHPG